MEASKSFFRFRFGFLTLLMTSKATSIFCLAMSRPRIGDDRGIPSFDDERRWVKLCSNQICKYKLIPLGDGF